MNRICDFMIGKSSKKMMIISTIVFVLFMIVVLPRVSAYTEDVTGSSNSPDTSLIYSSDDLFDIGIMKKGISHININSQKSIAISHY
mgnify:CR=1 FL=1